MSSTLFPSMNSVAPKLLHIISQIMSSSEIPTLPTLFSLTSTRTLKTTWNSNFFFPPTSPIHVRSSFLGHLLTWMPYLVLTLLISVIYNFMQIFILSPARFCSQWLSQSTNSSIFLGPQFDLTAPALDSYSIPCTSVP